MFYLDTGILAAFYLPEAVSARVQKFYRYFVNSAPRQASGCAVAILGHRAAGKNARRAIPSLGGAKLTK